jgi:hypothetical protein
MKANETLAALAAWAERWRQSAEQDAENYQDSMITYGDTGLPAEAVNYGREEALAEVIAKINQLQNPIYEAPADESICEEANQPFSFEEHVQNRLYREFAGRHWATQAMIEYMAELMIKAAKNGGDDFEAMQVMYR